MSSMGEDVEVTLSMLGDWFIKLPNKFVKIGGRVAGDFDVLVGSGFDSNSIGSSSSSNGIILHSP